MGRDRMHPVAFTRTMCQSRIVRRPQVRVVLGAPTELPADLVVLPGRKAQFREPRTAFVVAPRWEIAGGSELMLANAYRAAMASATQRKARSLVLPAILARGPWPIEDVTRVAMTVLMSTPCTAEHITIAVPTPAALEAWAEALM